MSWPRDEKDRFTSKQTIVIHYVGTSKQGNSSRLLRPQLVLTPKEIPAVEPNLLKCVIEPLKVPFESGG